MLNERQLQEFEEKGHLTVPEVFSEMEIELAEADLAQWSKEFRQALTEKEKDWYLEDDSGEDAPLRKLDSPVFHREAFHKLATKAALVEMVEQLIGKRVTIVFSQVFLKPPEKGGPKPIHQDNHYFSINPPNAMTAWLALDPVDLENGCLRYIAGSHRTGRRPHSATRLLGFSQGITNYGPDDEERETAVELQQGDLVVHHCETIHRADPNRSTTRHRRAFAMVFFGHSCCPDEESRKNYAAELQQQHESLGLDTD